MHRPPKASDIPDAELLAAVRAVRGGNRNVPHLATLWDIQGALPQYPKKVVRAKLASAIRRKLLDGCTCGCRGDFEILGEGARR